MHLQKAKYELHVAEQRLRQRKRLEQRIIERRVEDITAADLQSQIDKAPPEESENSTPK